MLLIKLAPSPAAEIPRENDMTCPRLTSASFDSFSHFVSFSHSHSALKLRTFLGLSNTDVPKLQRLEFPDQRNNKESNTKKEEKQMKYVYCSKAVSFNRSIVVTQLRRIPVDTFCLHSKSRQRKSWPCQIIAA